MPGAPGDWKSRVEETDDSPAAAHRVVTAVQRIAGGMCRVCRAHLCGHQALFSLMMGFQEKPVCAKCLAETLQWTGEQLRDQLAPVALSRKSYRAGWLWANGSEEFAAEEARPKCLWSC